MSTRLRLTLLCAAAVLLAAASLTAVFSDGSWVTACLGSTAAVALGSAAARAARVPRPLVPVAGLACLLLYLTAAFVGEPAVWRLWPGPAAWSAMVDLVGQAVEDITSYRAPISPGPGVVALTSGGVGLVAVLVDTAAVTYRRASWAGLPLLALFIVPSVLSPDGAGPWLFVLGTTGWLVLLVADSRDRLARWGRPLGYRAGDAPRERRYVRGASDPVSTVGRRVGFASLAAALAVPLLLPGLNQPLIHGPGPGRGGGSGDTNRTVAVVNPIIDLRSDLVRGSDAEVLRFRSADASPDYLRMVTLDSFTGTSWAPRALTNIPSRQRVDQGLPTVPGLGPEVSTQRVETTISVAALGQRWLPLPYGASSVDIEGTWLYDLASRNVFSTDRTTQGLTYTVVSLRPKPTVEQLTTATTDDGPAIDLEHPPLPAIVTQTATSVTEQASSPYGKAVALQDWLRSAAFTYTTDAPNASGTTAVEAFLRDRRGFCVHYASTMALMARSLGIPARVNVGFTPGTQQDDGSWSVSLGDAHAWPELWFDGVGWVRFEPTPSVRSQTVPDYAQQAVPGTTPGSTVDDLNGAAGAPANNGQRDPRVARADRELDGSGAGSPTGSGGPLDLITSGRSVRPFITSVAALALLLWLPALLRAGRRRWRWRRIRPLPEAAWDRLRDDARDLGYGWSQSESPRQAAARLAAQAPLSSSEAAFEDLRLLVSAVEQARYAPAREEKVLAGNALVGAQQLARWEAAVHRGLARHSGRATRLRALLLPRSVLDLRHAAGSGIADGLDRVDQTLDRAVGRPMSSFGRHGKTDVDRRG